MPASYAQSTTVYFKNIWQPCTLHQIRTKASTTKPLPGNTKGGSFTVPLTSCSTGLDYSVLQIKTTISSCHTADSKPVKQEVNGTVILPPLELPALT